MDGTAHSCSQQRMSVRTLAVAAIIAALSVLLATTGPASVAPQQSPEPWSPLHLPVYHALCSMLEMHFFPR